MEILISSKAEKQFNSLPIEIQGHIKDSFSKLKEEGLNANLDIKKLIEYPYHYRVRIVRYRIKMQFEKPDILKIY